MDTLGKRIKMYRQQRGISQRKFAKLVGTSPGLISFIERDRNKPNYQIVGRMAKILGTTCDYLIYGEEAALDPTHELIEKLKSEMQIDSGKGIKLRSRERDLIERYNLLSRLASLPRTDLEIVMEILRRIEQVR